MAVSLEHGPIEPKVHHALRVIQSTYGDVCSTREKGKNLFKFGRNFSAGTSEETIMEMPGTETSETYATTNAIDAIVSNNASNTFNVKIEGHTVTGTGTDSEFSFVVQSATLNGQTPVSLTTPLARMTRLYNDSGTELQTNSTVYGYESSGGVTAGVPDDDTTVHIMLTDSSGANTSLKGSTTLSNQDYALIEQVYFGIDKKTSASCDFSLKIREAGKVFRTVLDCSLGTTSDPYGWLDVDPIIIVPKNADVILTAIASTTNVDVFAGFNSVLALKVG